MTSSQAIGMFDSGVGGLTVMQQVMRLLPHEAIVYFGDTARVPYGNKSPQTILRYSQEIAHFLMHSDIKLLVIACNTANAYSIEELQKSLPIPIVGVIAPGAKKAVSVTRNGRIAVLATKATTQSGAYKAAILSCCGDAQVTSIACPLLVPIVEENFVDHEAARLILRHYLAPLKKERVDTILLGCTHYPLLKELIQEEAGDGVTIVDSATTCAEEVQSLLQQRGLEAPQRQLPTHRYIVSDDPSKLEYFGDKFLQMHIPEVELVTELTKIEEMILQR